MLIIFFTVPGEFCICVPLCAHMRENKLALNSTEYLLISDVFEEMCVFSYLSWAAFVEDLAVDVLKKGLGPAGELSINCTPGDFSTLSGMLGILGGRSKW